MPSSNRRCASLLSGFCFFPFFLWYKYVNHKMHKFYFVLSLIFSLAAVGCGPKVTRVSGKVLLDGQGLENMSVLFQPIGAQRESAFGITDSEGRFTLKRVFSNKNGVEPGDYSVFIGWLDTAPRSEFGATPPSVCPYKIPDSVGNGTLVRQVESQGPQTLDFELSEIP